MEDRGKKEVEEEDEGEIVEEPEYLKLRYNEVTMKGSHETQAKEEDILEQLKWDPVNTYNCGCRNLEFDINQSFYENEWSSNHPKKSKSCHGMCVGYKKGDSIQLKRHLSVLLDWSNKTEHDVITIHLDLKQVGTGYLFSSQLDEYITKHFDVNRIFKPCDLMGDCENLRVGAKKNGWPILRELKDKFIFVLTGDWTLKEMYSQTEPRKRLCFADIYCGAKEKKGDYFIPKDPHRVFFNYNIWDKRCEEWMEVFEKISTSHPEIIVREWVANGERNWNNCLRSGCSIISTDNISGATKEKQWATVWNLSLLTEKQKKSPPHPFVRRKNVTLRKRREDEEMLSDEKLMLEIERLKNENNELKEKIKTMDDKE